MKTSRNSIEFVNLTRKNHTNSMLMLLWGFICYAIYRAILPWSNVIRSHLIEVVGLDYRPTVISCARKYLYICTYTQTQTILWLCPLDIVTYHTVFKTGFMEDNTSSTWRSSSVYHIFANRKNVRYFLFITNYSAQWYWSPLINLFCVFWLAYRHHSVELNWNIYTENSIYFVVSIIANDLFGICLHQLFSFQPHNYITSH